MPDRLGRVMEHRAFVAAGRKRLPGRAADEAWLDHYASRPASRSLTQDPLEAIFSPAEVRRIIDRRSQRLVQPIDERVWVETRG